MSNVIDYKEVYKRKLKKYNELKDTNPRSDMILVLYGELIKLNNWEYFEKTGRWR